MDFFHALEGIVTVMSIVAVGYVMTKKGVLNEENAKIIPSLVIFVSLPVYMLWNLTTAFDKESLIAQLYGLAVPFGSMLLTCLLAVVTSDILAVGSGRKGVFRTIFFCSNAVFIGIPVNLALFGEISLPYVLMYFFINTCFFWTAGNYFIAKDGAASAVKFISIQSLKKACSPPMLSVMLAVTLILSGVRFPEFLTATAKQLRSEELV
jgi:predicted permease